MATTKEPVVFCNLYPDASLKVSLNLPFGMPKLEAPDLTCEGMSVFVGNATASISAFYPVIRIADCILKVIEAIKAIPDALGPPPNPGKIAEKIGALAECVPLFLGFTGVDPTPYCRFIRDLTGISIGVLTCLKNTLTVAIENDQAVEVLNASGDASLMQHASCLAEQSTKLKAIVKVKFDSMKLVITLLNAILNALPPVKQIIGDINPGSNDFSPEAVDDLIAALTVVKDLANGCSLGG